MRKKIKTIFFDIGGVLLDLRPEDMGNYWAEKSGVSGETIKEGFPWEAFYSFEKGQLSEAGFHRSFSASLPDGHDISRAEFYEGWNRMVGEETRVVEMLKKISRSIPAWLLSNTNPVHIHTKAADYSFLRYTSGEIYSYDVGFRKPEPEIYRAALKAAGRKPEECVFVDDMEENIARARSLGIDGIIYDDPEGLEDELGKRGLLDA